MSANDFAALDRAGLNLQAVFDLDALPDELAADLRRRFDPAGRYRQLILLGHAGRTLWTAVQAASLASADPIDDFSVATATAWFAERCPGRAWRIVYPGDAPVGLQALGKLAGWHHPTPFMIGIQPGWGTWYAYRLAMLADSDLVPTRPLRHAPPCASCAGRPCVAACPADALAGEGFALERCIAYRRRDDSRCKATCVARLACPVGAEHRYDEAQLRHTYAISLRAIEEYCADPGPGAPRPVHRAAKAPGA